MSDNPRNRTIEIFREWAWLFLPTGLVGMAVIAFMVFEKDSSGTYPYRLEALKTLLQFFLITGLGGMLVAALGQLRDKENRQAQDRKDADNKRLQEQKDNDARRMSRISALQSLDRELDVAYRSIKVVKRSMRTRIVCKERSSSGRPIFPYKIPAGAFEENAFSLLKSQITLEDIRAHIWIRTDLFSEEAIGLITKSLEYAARCYHDVFEDFERGRIRREDEYYIIDEACPHMELFLSGKKFPGSLDESGKILVAEQYDIFIDEKRLISERFDALKVIDGFSSDSGSVHFRSPRISNGCFDIAFDKIRATLTDEINGVSWRASQI